MKGSAAAAGFSSPSDLERASDSNKAAAVRLVGSGANLPAAAGVNDAGGEQPDEPLMLSRQLTVSSASSSKI